MAVTLAEMVGSAGADVTVPGGSDPAERLFSEAVGRVVVETTDPDAVRERVGGVAPVETLGTATDTGRLELTVAEQTLSYTADEIASLRDAIPTGLE